MNIIDLQKMKICAISDTHGLIPKLPIPEGDILIHAGDCTNRGLLSEIDNFLRWFDSIPGFKYKIFIAGNHDWGFQDYSLECEELLKNYPNIIYLQDSQVIIEGIKIYGSPWQPEFHQWAFNLPRGERLVEKWNLIPKDTNILVTHSPAHGIGDFVPYNGGENVGCKDLLDKIYNLDNLKLHISGHIHYSYGQMIKNNVISVNASLCTERYECINKPIIIEI